MNLLPAFTSLVRRRRRLYLYNTLAGSKQEFSPMPHAREVRMYNCGPTVYDRQHIGNLSMFVFTDVLRRTLEYNGFVVKQVINITDVGHLSSDADDGDDKMTMGLKREGLALTLENMRALGEKFTNIFLEDIRSLGVETERIEFPRASDYLTAEIAMIKTLEEKGYTYSANAGVYFDTSRFPDYGKLGNINLEGQREGARVQASDKRHPTDFLLWKADPAIGYESPWGRGFPGWHIECSAMVRSCLGQQIDIHTGGIEHIPVHHNNEIAQSESATGKKPLARFWLHRAHMRLDGGKMSKSNGNVVYLSDIIERGFHPLALRYLMLGAHYRTPSNFTWEALTAAQSALNKLLAVRLSLPSDGVADIPATWKRRFLSRINDDLDTPGALAVIWEMVNDKKLPPSGLLAALLDFDRVFGLSLAQPDDLARKLAASELHESIALDSLPERVRGLIAERDEARAARNWVRADELRELIAAEGYATEDTSMGTRIYKL